MTDQSTLGGDTVSRKVVKKAERRRRADHNETCDECGDLKKHVDEPMMSGFTGYICVNTECAVDS